MANAEVESDRLRGQACLCAEVAGATEALQISAPILLIVVVGG